MRYLSVLIWVGLSVATASTQTISTQGIYDLVKRRIPQYSDSFQFSLVNAIPTVFLSASDKPNDQYVISSTSDGKVLIEGNSLSALSSGLHRYLFNVAHVDLYWFIGNRLDVAPFQFPHLTEPINGSSIVPWRYDLNTVTFSYTAAFWDWDDWELQLDWMALHGINLPLAWVGFEKTLIDVFQEIGLTDAEISSFLSGPAFQAWNRFGNIQGTWGGDLPYAWINGQFDLQQKIIPRMVELGMTPVLPAFTGFVPPAITRVFPNASVVTAPSWAYFPPPYSNDTFLEPFDDHFAQLQKSFISKQQAAFGNVSNIYTLDQYNELLPYSGDTSYLTNIASSTINSLKAADPNAIWMMQGWLFFEASAFWTSDRIEAYLSGVQNSDMLILDLFSESMPQWQRTNSYYGKSWIWCMVHNFGGSLGIYGQIENITQSSMQALADSSSLIGFGLTMEGQAGNEIIYDLLLEQAWSETPVNTEIFFHDWVTARYAGSNSIPQSLYQGWDILRTTAYNNTNLTLAFSITRSIYVNEPAISGLADIIGWGGTITVYDPAVLVQVWKYFYSAAATETDLWLNPSYQYDMVDVTRQVMANAFTPLYTDLVDLYTQPNASRTDIVTAGGRLIDLLNSVDTVLSTNTNFQLSQWINSARASAQASNESEEAFFEYNARNQITLWGPTGEIDNYAAKEWAGLISTYYLPKWKMFVEYLASTPVAGYNQTAFQSQLLDFDLKWQTETLDTENAAPSLQGVVKEIMENWPDVFDS